MLLPSRIFGAGAVAVACERTEHQFWRKKLSLAGKKISGSNTFHKDTMIKLH